VSELRVHRIAFSTNVERVSLALAHKGLTARWVDVDPNDRRPVAELSGQELVPVLEVGHEVVPESMAIVAWIEDQYPQQPLWPADRARRAETDIAIQWFDQVWKRPPNEIDEERARLVPDETSIANDAKALLDWLPWFEHLLDGRDFLLGDTLGAFDVCAFPFLKYGVVPVAEDDTESFHHVLAGHLPVAGRLPRLEAWIRRVDALPRA
jgi:glutathione S-transferase